MGPDLQNETVGAEDLTSPPKGPEGARRLLQAGSVLVRLTECPEVAEGHYEVQSWWTS